MIMSRRATEKGSGRSQRKALPVVWSAASAGEASLGFCHGLHLHVGVRMVRERQPRIAVGIMIWR